MSEINLNNFFIFNSTFNIKEGEEQERILYYYPSSTNIDSQIKDMGLVEAVIHFTSTFKPTKCVTSLKAVKKHQFYIQPEPGFWMVMTLNVPSVVKSKDNVQTVEYLEDDIQSNIYENVLQQAYSMFKLFHNKFSYVIEENSLSALKTKLQRFYEQYFENLNLSYCDILNTFNGIMFLPLDRSTFLNVQCFVNSLENNFPIIHYTLFLYNDYLIWSGLESNDMQTLYHYLIHVFLPPHIKSELTGGSIPRIQKSPFASCYHGRFITGIEDKNLKVDNIPKIYIFNDSEFSPYHIIIYRILSASVCLFVEEKTELTLETFKEIENFMAPEVTAIVSDVAEYTSKKVAVAANNACNSSKYIYFNKQNLAYKSTVHLDNKKTGNLACSFIPLRCMADLKSATDNFRTSKEIIAKTLDDYWIACRCSNFREFYVVLQQKDANLIDINDEVEKVAESELSGIFF